MLFHFLGAFAAAVAAAGSIWLFFRTLRRPTPRWLMPLAAGAALLGFAAWSEYTWESRTIAALPAQVVIAKRYSSADWFSPWTYVLPRVDRMTAVDRAMVRRNPAHPDIVLVEVLLLSRLEQVGRSPQVFDCARPRRAELRRDQPFDRDGMPVDVRWEELPRDDPLLQAACGAPR